MALNGKTARRVWISVEVESRLDNSSKMQAKNGIKFLK